MNVLWRSVVEACVDAVGRNETLVQAWLPETLAEALIWETMTLAKLVLILLDVRRVLLDDVKWLLLDGCCCWTAAVPHCGPLT